MNNLLATEFVYLVNPEKEFLLELCRWNHGESAMLDLGWHHRLVGIQKKPSSLRHSKQ